MLLVLVDSLRC